MRTPSKTPLRDAMKEADATIRMHRVLALRAMTDDDLQREMVFYASRVSASANVSRQHDVERGLIDAELAHRRRDRGQK